jgi:hypothetical protein
MDDKLPPFPYEGLGTRANLIWFAICGSGGLVVVLGVVGYELAAELVAATLCLSIGLVTLVHRDVFDRFYAASMAYWAVPTTDPRHQKRLDGLERSRKLQRIIVPPFAILLGLGFLAGVIESIVR